MISEQRLEKRENPDVPSSGAKPGAAVPWRSAWLKSVQLRSVLFFSAAVAAIIFCVLHVVAPPEPVPKSFSFDPGASWITTSSTQQSFGCFRFDFEIRSKIANAWITVAANGGYEVLTNGNESGHLFLLSPTHPFQKGLSEVGQKLNPGDPAIAVNFPREYQWNHHDNAELPTWVDLTTDLRQGHNTLCVEVETNTTTPALILSGEVLLETGEKIPIRSNSEWKAEPVPKVLPHDHWTLANFPVTDWRPARTLPWKRLFWTLVPKDIYEKPFRAQKIRSPLNDSVTWIEQDFNLSKRVAEGFLRVVTDTRYQVWINGHYVRPPTHADGVLPFGPWFVREIVRSPIDVTLESQPEWLDPYDVGTLLPGQQKEIPPSRDAATNDFAPDQQKILGTSNIPYAPSELPSGDSAQRGNPRGVKSNANLENPETAVPPALIRDRRSVEFVTYGVGPLLREGLNTIRIGLYKKDLESIGLTQEPFIAFDGGAALVDGSDSSFASGPGIRCYSIATSDQKLAPAIATVDAPIEPHLLPGKAFFQQVSPDRPWGCVSLVFFFVCTILGLIGTSRSPRLAELMERGQLASVLLAGWVCAGLILRSSMLERSDALYWRFPVVWALLLIIGVTGAMIALILQKLRLRRAGFEALEHKASFLRNWSWYLLLGLAVVFCFVFRAWQMDLQPPDADEYTSLQAILSIQKTGLPEYQPGIWYTRSALFHYLAAAVSSMTGGDIYTLRMLAVIFSCATVVLVWRMAEELTLSRFYAFCAAILFAVEPYLVFTGHVSRFYQQHQFFNLLLVYFFVRGFVVNTGMKDRYSAILAFLAGVLSQEITILQIVPMVICYIAFARRRSWPDEIRLVIASGCAAAVVALDVGFHLLKCLTPLEGISPRVEARVGWCIEKLANFFTLFISYSRLHLVLSAFLIPGFVIACRRKQMVATALYVYLFISVMVVNILITSKGYRFQYYLIPLWIILSIHGIAECARLLIPAWKEFPARMSLAGGWVAFAICSFSPWRMFNSYDGSLGGDPTRPLSFVRENLRPTDRVAITEPYPDAATVELGRCDYDISIPILYDFSYRTRGKLVDRNGGAEVIGNLNELQRAFAKCDRLWIVFDRYTLHSRGQKILWEYPAARVQLYLHNNCQLVFRSYLWSVYLWDRNAGHYATFREKPANWFD